MFTICFLSGQYQHRAASSVIQRQGPCKIHAAGSLGGHVLSVIQTLTWQFLQGVKLLKRMPMVTLDLWMDRPNTLSWFWQKDLHWIYAEVALDIRRGLQSRDIDRYYEFRVYCYHVETCKGSCVCLTRGRCSCKLCLALAGASTRSDNPHLFPTLVPLRKCFGLFGAV